MIKILVDSTTQVRERTTKTGKVLRFQDAFLKTDKDPYPIRFQILLWDRSPFLPGEYSLNSDSVRVNRYGQLEIGTVFLDVAD